MSVLGRIAEHHRPSLSIEIDRGMNAVGRGSEYARHWDLQTKDYFARVI